LYRYESDTNSTPNNEIGFNAIQRKCLSVTIGQDVRIELYVPPTEMAVSVMNISVDLLRKAPSGQPIKIESAELMETFMTQYDGQIFRIGQQFPMNFNGEKLDLVINTLDHVNIGMGGSKPKTFSNDSGQVIRNVSSLTFSKRKDSTSALIIIAPAEGRNDNLFRQDFDFEKMDIGGLGKEFEVIFRRAFASRVFPGLIKELGVNHVRGMLLYGPPGCG
jgi:vesicle-fusing ATPase